METESTPPPQHAEPPRAPENFETKAAAFGRFYTSLIDTGLTPTAEDFTTRAQKLAASLPPTLQEFGNKSTDAITQGLSANHEKTAQHKGQETQYLLRVIMEQEGMDGERIKEVLEKSQQPGNVLFLEPTPGIPILQASHSFYDYLVDTGVVSKDSEATMSQYDDPKLPNCMILKRYEYQETLGLETTPAANHTVRHETSHLYWNLLRNANLVANSTEDSSEKRTACNLFRTEMAAYIIGGTLRYEDIEQFVYTDDDDILEQATEVRQLAEMGVSVATWRNTDHAGYIFAALQATSFPELKDMILKLTPDGEQLVKLHDKYAAWSRQHFPTRVTEKPKTLPFTPQQLEEYSYYVLSYRFHTLAQLKIHTSRMQQFARSIGVENADISQVYQIVASRISILKKP